MENARVSLPITKRMALCIDSALTIQCWLLVVMDVLTSVARLRIPAQVTEWPWLPVLVYPIKISNSSSSTLLVFTEPVA
jgi:hypothetical protein